MSVYSEHANVKSVTNGSAWPYEQELVCLTKLLVGQGQIVI